MNAQLWIFTWCLFRSDEGNISSWTNFVLFFPPLNTQLWCRCNEITQANQGRSHKYHKTFPSVLVTIDFFYNNLAVCPNNRHKASSDFSVKDLTHPHPLNDGGRKRQLSGRKSIWLSFRTNCWKKSIVGSVTFQLDCGKINLWTVNSRKDRVFSQCQKDTLFSHRSNSKCRDQNSITWWPRNKW